MSVTAEGAVASRLGPEGADARETGIVALEAAQLHSARLRAPFPRLPTEPTYGRQAGALAP